MIDWLKAGLPAGVPRETRSLFTVKKFANCTAYVKGLLPSASMRCRRHGLFLPTSRSADT
jgi:hypothetical protein